MIAVHQRHVSRAQDSGAGGRAVQAPAFNFGKARSFYSQISADDTYTQLRRVAAQSTTFWRRGRLPKSSAELVKPLESVGVLLGYQLIVTLVAVEPLRPLRV